MGDKVEKSECAGCINCRPIPEIVGECAVCGDLIYADENMYIIGNSIIHNDCLSSWAEQYLEVS